MTKDEFLALPATLALRVLFDALDESAAQFIADTPAPKIPRSPKYDAAIYRSQGIMWASETDLEGLRYWHKKYTAGANSGGEYADKDKKRAETLARWIVWREVFPETAWSGERNEQQVTAKPPSNKPAVYPRQGGNGAARRPPSPVDEDIDPDAEIPF